MSIKEAFVDDIARPIVEVAHRILRIFLILDESG